MINGNILDELNTAQTKFDDLEMNIGDTIVVHYKITEGGNEVGMKFKGILIADKGRGINRCITVRHLTGGVGVERVFPINAPFMDEIEITRRGETRRARLFYIRNLTGKAATQVKEKKFVPKPKEKAGK